MLKLYTKLEEVPEALREHYTLVDGRYVPQLSDDHPTIVYNKKLLSEKWEATAKITELTNDVEEAKKTNIPRGHVAVAKADAELLTEVKALGAIADIKTKLAEHDTLKAEVTKTQRVDNLRKVASKLGYNEAAFLQLAGLPDMEIRGEGEKETVVAIIKDGEKTVEKPAAEYVEANYGPLLPALKADQGTSVIGSIANTQQSADPFASAREWGKQYNEQHKPSASLVERFGLAKSA